ncbi:hypothetical protein D0810_14825 [Vibrio cholerae]|uniref:hypothetical protein n=1 Tax=Vibrio cholerae TaxID=666 RepID=UPI0002DC380A|nr:hypothetical protein [Vibrio cholerae]EGQ9962420.1 hypothetical protein [Vibrio cholerae]EGR0073144.1 hypothetical protein [Vibrio cholerae]EGR2141010.1 hypothetical protein [Vibrio cholerae]EGR2283033.1 hypothetical protein [Vibrio cholerae]EJL6959281.1 hypothetical protein [Vibrio cholerae]
MARWHKETKHRCKHKGFVFEFDTAAELGKMVAESGCPMSNPYEPGFTEYDDFAEAFHAVRESKKKHLKGSGN